jgi:hypothetical protein
VRGRVNKLSRDRTGGWQKVGPNASRDYDDLPEQDQPDEEEYPEDELHHRWPHDAADPAQPGPIPECPDPQTTIAR